MDFYSILKEWRRGRIVLSDTHHSTKSADYIIFQISTTKQTDNIKKEYLKKAHKNAEIETMKTDLILFLKK